MFEYGLMVDVVVSRAVFFSSFFLIVWFIVID